MVNKINNHIADMLNMLPDNSVQSGVLKVSTDHKVTLAAQSFMEKVADNFNWALRSCKRVENAQMHDDLHESIDALTNLTSQIREGVNADRNEILNNGIDESSLNQIYELDTKVGTKYQALNTALVSYQSFSKWGRVDKQTVEAYAKAVSEFRNLKMEVESLQKLAASVMVVQKRKDHFIQSFVDLTLNNLPENKRINRADPVEMRDYMLFNIKELKNRNGSPDLKLRFDVKEPSSTQMINAFEAGFLKRAMLNFAGWGAGSLSDTTNALRSINRDFSLLISSLRQTPSEEVKGFAHRKLADFMAVSTLFSDLLNTYYHTDPDPSEARKDDINALRREVSQAMRIQRDLEVLADFQLPEPVYTEMVHENMLSVELPQPQPQPVVVQAPAPAPAPAPIARPFAAPIPTPAPRPTPQPAAAPAPAPIARPVSAPAPAPAPVVPELQLTPAPPGGTHTFDSSTNLYVFRTRYGGVYTEREPFTREDMDKFTRYDYQNDWTNRHRKYQ